MTPRPATAPRLRRRPVTPLTLAYLDLLEGRLTWLAPQLFDYRWAGEEGRPDGSPPGCGCLVFHLERGWADLGSLEGAGLAEDEAEYLMGFGPDPDDPGYERGQTLRAIDPTAKDFTTMTTAEAAGTAGVAEAVRRIGVIRRRIEARAEAEQVAQQTAVGGTRG